MRTVIVAWHNPGRQRAFEESVPLRFLGRHSRSRGFETEVDVLFLYGMEALPLAYREELADLGYSLHDVSANFRGVAARYSVLRRFGEFEFCCFMRWLVLLDYFEGSPLLHFDGDIVFNECPKVLGAAFGGSDLVVQGCPAVTSLGGSTWLRAYAAELRRFADAVDDYSAAAWAERRGWEASQARKWAGSRHRRLISSDQDLISHLIHTDRIPQTDPGRLHDILDRYVIAENPLHLGELTGGLPLSYSRRAGVDRFGGRRMMFWHMQSDWCRYLDRYLTRERCGERWAARRLAFEVGGSRRLARLRRWLLPPRSRLDLYRRFFQDGDFSGIFRGAVWWKPGVFD